MNWRDAKYNSEGTIDCEIEHPELGWIPFTAVEGDTGSFFDVDEMISEIVADGNIAEYVAPDPYEELVANFDSLVNEERDRRLLEGKSFSVTGHQDPIHLNILDETNLGGLATSALVQVSLGNGSSTVQWRDNNNTVHTITFEQVLELHTLASQYKQDIYSSSWALKTMEVKPENYTNDLYWP